MPSHFKGSDGADRETVAADKLSTAQCDATIIVDDLDSGLQLGSQFLARSQQPEGNFRYEFDWLSQKESLQDNAVRQAGTLWALTLMQLDDPKLSLMPAIRKGLAYFEKNSVKFPSGARLMVYPGMKKQKLGAVALVTLAHIEVLRRPEALDTDEKARIEESLGGYLKGIVDARDDKGNFHGFYDSGTGKSFGPNSGYYDGECLLALAKAAKYLGHDDLWPSIKVSAEAGWRANAERGVTLAEGRAKAKFASKFALVQKKMDDAAKKSMAGYYQWSHLAWYELMGTADADYKVYASRMLRYTDAIVKMHRPGDRSDHNFGQLMEGVIPAFITAVQQGDQEKEQRFGCAIRAVMQNGHSLQVGHEKANGLIEPLSKEDAAKVGDERAEGGVQFTKSSPALRIDTTQHHLHALLMARRLLQKQAIL
jgi:hypothetical protein